MTQEAMIKTMMDAAGPGVTRAGMERAYKALFEGIVADAKEGNSTTIRGFGTFSLKETKARVGRNPQTGNKIEIPAGKKLSFKNSSALKEEL